MEYISVEEFLKQDKEVQKVFLDWWQPQENDLFQCSKFGKDIVLSYDESRLDNEILSNCGGCCYSKNEVIPLFTEGQIRQFVEDKTCGISSIYFRCNNISINVYDNNSPTCIKRYERLGIDLLQAYWKVALEIVKESQ